MRIPDWTPERKPQPQDLVQAILERRGGELLNLDRALLWSEPFAEECNNRGEDRFSWAIAWEEIPAVFARLCTRVLQAAHNEPVATALIESLGYNYRGNLPHTSSSRTRGGRTTRH